MPPCAAPLRRAAVAAGVAVVPVWHAAVDRGGALDSGSGPFARRQDP
jgi:hypothetical protein